MRILAAFLMTVGSIVLLECLLRLFGLFAPCPPFQLDESGSRYVGNPAWRPLWKNRPAYPMRASFDACKQPGTIRIFCVGGSTVYGVPFRKAESFPSRLAGILSDRLPKIRVEVVNAAVGGISSLEESGIVAAIMHHQPDAVVLLDGHNEFLLPYVLQAVKEEEAPVAWSLRRMMEQLRVGRAALDLLAPLLDVRSKGATRTGENPTNDPWSGGLFDRGLIYRVYERNIRRIAGCVVRAGNGEAVRLVLCIPPVNLVCDHPLRSAFSSSTPESARRKWREALAKGENLEALGDLNGALKEYHAAEAIDSVPADLHHRIGHVLLAMGRLSDAKEELEKAIEADLQPWRADRGIRSIIRACASEYGAVLVDVHEAFEKALRGRLVDQDLKYLVDGVHLTPAGNRLAAEAVAQAMAEADFPVPQEEWSEYHGPCAAERKADERSLQRYKNYTRVLIDFGKAVVILSKAQENLEGSEELVACAARIFDEILRLAPHIPHGMVGKALVAAWRCDGEEASRLFTSAAPKEEALRLLEDLVTYFPNLASLAEQCNRAPPCPTGHD